jgi:hypothetical protein
MLAALGFIAGEAVEDKTPATGTQGISGPAIVHFQQTKQASKPPVLGHR